MNWWRGFKGKIKLKELLKGKTTFKIGGEAEFFSAPSDIKDLKLLVTAAAKFKIPIFVMGAGSNVLIGDKGIKGIVVQLKSPGFKKVSCRRNYLEAASGMTLAQLINAAKKHGLSGIEFLAGIPGTLGGALAMNAGAWGKNIADFVEKVKVMDYNGGVKIIDKKDLKFAYRKSSLEKFIILGATLKLTKADKAGIEKNVRQILRQRIDTQDRTLPNAGCIFKNPRKDAAGRLIDLCGLKGRAVGDACVSLRHANFILNRGNARARDVLDLMELIQENVKNKFGINLEPEIKIWA